VDEEIAPGVSCVVGRVDIEHCEDTCVAGSELQGPN
jgi:hypothetical protein